MVLDADFLTQILHEQAKEALSNSLRLVRDRARELAPVREIFKQDRKSSRKMSAADVSSGRNFVGASGGSFKAMSAGRENSPVFSGGRKAKTGRRVVENLRVEGQVKTLGSVPSKQRGFANKVGGSITGRTNSFAPVIKTKAGRVGGEQLRHWAGHNTLSVATINVRGKVVNLADSLNARGRYELRTGRSVTPFGSGGHAMVGGTLREGITIEGPFDSGDSVYGFVSAYAADPMFIKRKNPKHNYAADQEFGSRHNAPHPFLRPAFWESLEQIKSGQSAAISKAFRGAHKHTSEDNEKAIVLVLDISMVGWAQFARQWRKNLFPPEVSESL